MRAVAQSSALVGHIDSISTCRSSSLQPPHRSKTEFEDYKETYLRLYCMHDRTCILGHSIEPPQPESWQGQVQYIGIDSGHPEGGDASFKRCALSGIKRVCNVQLRWAQSIVLPATAHQQMSAAAQLWAWHAAT